MANTSSPSTNTSSSTKSTAFDYKTVLFTAPTTNADPKNGSSAKTLSNLTNKPSNYSNSTNNNSSKTSNDMSPPQINNYGSKSQKFNGHHHYSNTDNNCLLNSISVDAIKDDFDFESNLAMFDKSAFYEEMEGHSNSKPTVSAATFSNSQQQSHTQKYHQISLDNLFGSIGNGVKSTGSNSNGNGKNYRFDEMVLDTGEPVDMQQIKIRQSSGSNQASLVDKFISLILIRSEILLIVIVIANKKNSILASLNSKFFIFYFYLFDFLALIK